MTTLQQIELQCPICETRFRSQSVVSTNSFGGKRTDFHERAAGTQPLPYLIHTCNRCGYSGADRDFTEDADVSPVLKERVWNELAPCITLRHADGLREVRSRGEGRGMAGHGTAPRCRPAAARCVVLCGRGRRRSRAILPAKSGLEVRGGAGELRRRGARRASGADLPGRRAVEASRRRDARGQPGSTGCARRSSTRKRSSGSSTRRDSSATARANGSAERAADDEQVLDERAAHGGARFRRLGALPQRVPKSRSPASPSPGRM